MLRFRESDASCQAAARERNTALPSTRAWSSVKALLVGRQADPGRRQRSQPRRGCRGFATGHRRPCGRGISRCARRRGKFMPQPRRSSSSLHRPIRRHGGSPRTGDRPFFASLDHHYLIDVDNAIIVDVEARTAIRSGRGPGGKAGMIEQLDGALQSPPRQADRRHLRPSWPAEHAELARPRARDRAPTCSGVNA